MAITAVTLGSKHGSNRRDNTREQQLNLLLLGGALSDLTRELISNLLAAADGSLSLSVDPITGQITLSSGGNNYGLTRDTSFDRGGRIGTHGGFEKVQVDYSKLSGNAIVFEQETGRMYLRSADGELTHIANGASGNGAGRNNPGMEHVRGVGVIPEGVYHIGGYGTSWVTPDSKRLTPINGTDAHGRSLLAFHPALRRGGGSAGCVVSSQEQIDFVNQIIDSQKINKMIVVPRISALPKPSPKATTEQADSTDSPAPTGDKKPENTGAEGSTTTTLTRTPAAGETVQASLLAQAQNTGQTPAAEPKPN